MGQAGHLQGLLHSVPLWQGRPQGHRGLSWVSLKTSGYLSHCWKPHPAPLGQPGGTFRGGAVRGNRTPACGSSRSTEGPGGSGSSRPLAGSAALGGPPSLGLAFPLCPTHLASLVRQAFENPCPGGVGIGEGPGHPLSCEARVSLGPIKGLARSEEGAQSLARRPQRNCGIVIRNKNDMPSPRFSSRSLKTQLSEQHGTQRRGPQGEPPPL